MRFACIVQDCPLDDSPKFVLGQTAGFDFCSPPPRLRPSERHELYSALGSRQPLSVASLHLDCSLDVGSWYRYFLTGLSFISQVSMALTDAIPSAPQMRIPCSNVSYLSVCDYERLPQLYLVVCRRSTNIPPGGCRGSPCHRVIGYCDSFQAPA